MPFDNTKYHDLKVAIQEKVIPQLTLTKVEKGIDQRGYASALEKQFTDTCKDNFECKEALSVRSTDDITIIWYENGILTDYKTQDIDKAFSMPNLISIAVLKKKFWKEDILYTFQMYSSEQHKVLDSHSFYIWELPWEHLKIQNLGQGQLQIQSMKDFINNIDNHSTLSKDQWYQELIKHGEIFYKNLKIKTDKRLEEWVC